MKIADVSWAARQGKTELSLSQGQMAELVDDLTNDARYGVRIPPPFWLLGVCVRLSAAELTAFPLIDGKFTHTASPTPGRRMKIADVSWAARQGKTELSLSQGQMAEL